MITTDPRLKVVYVRGLHRMEDVYAAIREACGRKVNAGRWIVVPIAEDPTQNVNVIAGMPFDPPKVGDEGIGYKRPK